MFDNDGRDRACGFPKTVPTKCCVSCCLAPQVLVMNRVGDSLGIDPHTLIRTDVRCGSLSLLSDIGYAHVLPPKLTMERQDGVKTAV